MSARQGGGVADHYNTLASKFEEKRRVARTLPMRDFHNDVKSRLIRAVVDELKTLAHASRARDASDEDVVALLDIACGRGGDMWKWFHAGLAHVHGVDISQNSITECQDRLRKVENKHRTSLGWQFECRSDVTTASIPWPRKFDAVSCMFAAHYFFESESSASHALENASRGLRDGGLFFGTVTCGKRVIQLFAEGGRTARSKEEHETATGDYTSELLRIVRRWQPFDKYRPFGSAYTFAIRDTVTDDKQHTDELGEGCEEYLVFFKVFTELAAKHNLFPYKDFAWHSMPPTKPNMPANAFEAVPPDGKHVGFRHFSPDYSHLFTQLQTHSEADANELERISRLYAAFVFQKREPTSTKKRRNEDDSEDAKRAKVSN